MAVCSDYLPYDSEETPPSKEFEELVHYCESENLYLVIGCNSNTHHSLWASTKFNDRRVALVEFLNSLNLEVLNRSNDLTFCSGNRLELTDITWGPLGFWEASRAGGIHQNPPCRMTDILRSLYRALHQYVKSGIQRAQNGSLFGRT